MVKYFVGYKQDNNSYVYVSDVTYSTVRVTTIQDGAISFDDIETAKGLLNMTKKMVSNQDYTILKITNIIEEVQENAITSE